MPEKKLLEARPHADPAEKKTPLRKDTLFESFFYTPVVNVAGSNYVVRFGGNIYWQMHRWGGNSIVNIVNLYYVHGFLEGTVMDGSDFTNLGK